MFITFEGGEGSGKTTIIKRLYHEMLTLNYPVISTREPGGNKISEQIRKIILDKENKNMDFWTEALLYAASRRQHLIETIIPALSTGKNVLCDRYLDSSLAYQGHARGLGIEEIYDMNLYATKGLMPDVTFFMDVSPYEGLNRIQIRGRKVNRLDIEKPLFHAKVQEGYKMLAKRYPERIIVIDGERPIDDIYEEVRSIIFKKLERR